MGLGGDSPAESWLHLKAGAGLADPVVLSAVSGTRKHFLESGWPGVGAQDT